MHYTGISTYQFSAIHARTHTLKPFEDSELKALKVDIAGKNHQLAGPNRSRKEAAIKSTNRHDLIVLLRPAVGVVKVGAAAIYAELGAGGARGPVAEVGEVLLGAGEAQGVVQHLAGQGARQGVLTLQDLHVHHVGCLQRQANDRLLLLLLL